MDEVYAPIRQRLWLMIFLIGALLTSAGSGVSLIWRQQRIRFYREQYNSAEALRESEEKFRNVFDNSAISKSITSLDGTVHVNQAFCEMLGYENKELLEQKWQNISLPDDLELTQNHLAQLLSGQVKSIRFTRRYLSKDGSIVWADVQVVLQRDTQGQPLYYTTSVVDITDRKKAEEALKKSQEELLAILDATPFPIALVDVQDNNIDFWSRSALTLFGHTASTVNEWYQIAYPDPAYRNKVIRQWKPFLEKAQQSTQAVYTGEYRITCRDGSERICELYATFLADRLVVTFNDITERKQAEEKLLRLSSRQEAILSAVPAIIMEVDDKKVYTWANFAGLEFFGMDVIGKNADFYFEGEQDTYKAVQPLFNGYENLIYVESWQLRKDGQKRLLAWWCRVLKDERGKVTGALSSARDITEYKLAEDEIRKLNIELEDRVIKRTAQLEAANKELEAFSYSVSHDLRAPLRHVSGYVELLGNRFQTELPEKGKHYLDTIADSVRQMGTLIDDLLQFSRTGRAEMRESDLDMNRIVKDISRQLRQDNPERNITWAIARLPTVHGDPAMLQLVWMNLLNNAVKFTRKKKNARIEIGSYEEKKETVFFVRDNGVGFDMKYAQKLFGVFQRLHPKEDFEGTGIGLANLHRIILRHGGRTWAEAQLDKGATFYFTLSKKF